MGARAGTALVAAGVRVGGGLPGAQVQSGDDGGRPACSGSPEPEPGCQECPDKGARRLLRDRERAWTAGIIDGVR